MNDLITALRILSKYYKGKFPTCCEHDVLYVDVDPHAVLADDIRMLDGLGFDADYDNRYFYSYKYGSC